MNINIHFKHIDPSDALRDYATEKAESLSEYADDIIAIDVHIGIESEHHKQGDEHFVAEFNVELPHSPVISMEKKAEDLYKAIDKVKDHLKVELEKRKGKMGQIDREAIREQKGIDY